MCWYKKKIQTVGSGRIIIEYLQLPMLGSESRYRQTERAGS